MLRVIEIIKSIITMEHLHSFVTTPKNNPTDSDDNDEWNDLVVESKNMQINSVDQGEKGEGQVLQSDINKFKQKLTIFKDFEKCKEAFDNKQQQLLNYLISQQIKMNKSNNFSEYKMQVSQLPRSKTMKNDMSEFRAHQDHQKKQNSDEVKFLNLIKQKMASLQTAVKKERGEKLKLSKMLRDMKNNEHSSRADMSPMQSCSETPSSRLSFRKINSTHHNPFDMSNEKFRHRNTIIGRTTDDDQMSQLHDENNSSFRKSLDDTSSRLDEKYGEKFWQNQVQRVIKQSQNYSMLYNTNKKIKDQEKHDLRADNEKLLKKVKELENNLAKVNTELGHSKGQDSGAGSKKKFVMKPKKRLIAPSSLNEDNRPSSAISNIGLVTKAHSDLAINAVDPETEKSKISKPGPVDYVSKVPVKIEEEKASSKGSTGTVSIQPKTNTVHSVKGPLKNYMKKNDKVTSKNAASATSPSTISSEQVENEKSAPETEKKLNIKDSDFGTLTKKVSDQSAGSGRRSPNKKVRRIKPSDGQNPELTPNSNQFNLDAPPSTEGYLTQRNAPREEILVDMKSTSKDDTQPKARKIFGIQKKSVQVTDSRNLNSTLKLGKKKMSKNDSAKLNKTMGSNEEGKSMLKNKGSSKGIKGTLSRPASALKSISQANLRIPRASNQSAQPPRTLGRNQNTVSQSNFSKKGNYDFKNDQLSALIESDEENETDTKMRLHSFKKKFEAKFKTNDTRNTLKSPNTVNDLKKSGSVSIEDSKLPGSGDSTAQYRTQRDYQTQVAKSGKLKAPGAFGLRKPSALKPDKSVSKLKSFKRPATSRTDYQGDLDQPDGASD